LAYKLWREIDNKPSHLFVGAYSSPTILPNPILSLAREKFKARGYDEIPDLESLSSITSEARDQILAALHAVSPELQAVWESPELQQLILPTALAELHMVRGHTMKDTLAFNVPITAFHGEMDDKVKESEMHAWQKLTQGPFTFHALPGGHLFLHEDQDQKRLLELVSHHLEQYHT
jgi:surfactin synthase thioesterase subunit